MAPRKKKVQPHGFIRELDNIMTVELFRNGEEPPVVLWKQGAKLYRVEVTVYDVTEDPFYQKQGLIPRLDAARAKKDQK